MPCGNALCKCHPHKGGRDTGVGTEAPSSQKVGFSFTDSSKAQLMNDRSQHYYSHFDDENPAATVGLGDKV
jgi:hypothetical protein